MVLVLSHLSYLTSHLSGRARLESHLGVTRQRWPAARGEGSGQSEAARIERRKAGTGLDWVEEQP